MSKAEQYLAAGRADCIPRGDARLWYVRKFNNPIPIPHPKKAGRIRPAGQYTMLLRWTDSTMHLGHGECVMVDDPPELQTHLHAAMTAFGSVLVTGLGLGCVLRMLQHNPRVEQITVVEISKDVIDLVWPYTPHDRVELIHADAGKFLADTDRRWDVAWHDVWTDTANGDPHLAVKHQELMVACHGLVRRQGAWAFPRHCRRALARVLEAGNA